MGAIWQNELMDMAKFCMLVVNTETYTTYDYFLWNNQAPSTIPTDNDCSMSCSLVIEASAIVRR